MPDAFEITSIRPRNDENFLTWVSLLLPERPAIKVRNEGGTFTLSAPSTLPTNRLLTAQERAEYETGQSLTDLEQELDFISELQEHLRENTRVSVTCAGFSDSGQDIYANVTLVSSKDAVAAELSDLPLCLPADSRE